MSTEYERLKLVEEKFGKPAAIQFAKQTYNNYKTCLRQAGNYARNKQYRRSFVKSCIYFRKYLKENGESSYGK